MRERQLIMLSGIDGSGKSTLAASLQRSLDARGQRSVIVDAMKNGHYMEQLKRITREGAALRERFSAEMLNLAWTADLLYNFHNVVCPAMEDGYLVIMHRSDLCCRVYSEVFAAQDALSQRLLDALELPPHRNFFLRLSPEKAYARICGRNWEKALEIKEQLACLERADALYRQHLQTARYRETISLDAERPVLELANEILRHLA